VPFEPHVHPAGAVTRSFLEHSPTGDHAVTVENRTVEVHRESTDAPDSGERVQCVDDVADVQRSLIDHPTTETHGRGGLAIPVDAVGVAQDGGHGLHALGVDRVDHERGNRCRVGDFVFGVFPERRGGWSAPETPRVRGPGHQVVRAVAQLDRESHRVERSTTVVDAMFPVHDRTAGRILGVDGEGEKVLPVVAVETDRPRPFGSADVEEFGDADPATEDGHVEHRHRMHQPIGQLIGRGAVGQQEVLPMSDRVPTSGESMTDDLGISEHETSVNAIDDCFDRPRRGPRRVEN